MPKKEKIKEDKKEDKGKKGNPKENVVIPPKNKKVEVISIKHHKNPHNSKKVLFVLKKRSSYQGPYSISFGLVNSCKKVCEALEKEGYTCKIAEAIDSNFVDAEIYKFKPSWVVLEALWIEKVKIPVLMKLHPYVKKWTIRIHSKAGFIQMEGPAIGLIREYSELSDIYPNFSLSTNNIESAKELKISLGIQADYLPNIYLLDGPINEHKEKCYSSVLDVACFSSLRPLKNILLQAMSALGFAEKQGKILHFHIISDRIEQNGGTVLKNLKALFKDRTHLLVEHNWSNLAEFLKLVAKMDLGLQVSFNESMNLVSCDFLSQNIPIIGSTEIKFLFPCYQADMNSIEDIISKMEFAWTVKKLGFHNFNKLLLSRHNFRSIGHWLDYLD